MTPATRIGIVGMGAVGTTAAIQLIGRKVSQAKKGGLGRGLELHCFEEKNELGRGLAYSTPKDFHIMNMRTSTMSIDPLRPSDFREWLAERGAGGKTDLEYVPRHLFGSYLNQRWREALDAAEKHGIRVKVHRETVTDCQETRTGVVLTSGGRKISLDSVVLCLGHLPRKLSAMKFGGLEGFIECPFDFERIESLPKNASVGVIGTSLTAIDVVFSLKGSGFSGEIHCFSRKRHLPKVQSSAKPVKLQFYNKEKLRVLTNDFKDGIWLEHVFVLLEKDFAELSNGKKLSQHLFFGHREDIFASRVPDTVSVVEESLSVVRDGQPSWHTILDSTSDVISLVWNQLDFDDKKRFLSRIESIWTMYRHSMPQPNAERLLSIARTGCLKVHTGLVSSEFDEERQQFGLVAQRAEGGTPGVPTTQWVDYLIDATGTESRLDHIRSELLDNMMTRGQLSPHPLGGVDVDFVTSRLRDRKGNLSSRLYFVGQLTKGVHFYTNSYEMNRNNVQAVIDDVMTAG